MEKPTSMIIAAVASAIASRAAPPAAASALGIVAAGSAAAALRFGRYDAASILSAVAVGSGIAAAASRSVSSRTMMIDSPELAAHPSQGYPAALLFLPDGFSAEFDFDLLVYFRGWNSCVSVLAGDAPGRCRADGRTRQHSDLMGQVQRSGRNVALLMPELLVEQSTSDPGGLRDPMALKALIDASLSAAGVRGLALSSARRVLVASHSGGYVAAARAVDGLPGVSDVLLLDSLYGEVDSFARFANAGGSVVSIFTGGTTESKSRDLVSLTGGVFSGETGMLSDQDWRTRVIAHGSRIGHSAIPLSYVEPWLRTRD